LDVSPLDPDVTQVRESIDSSMNVLNRVHLDHIAIHRRGREKNKRPSFAYKETATTGTFFNCCNNLISFDDTKSKAYDSIDANCSRRRALLKQSIGIDSIAIVDQYLFMIVR
jgi:hypothetical protein